MPKTNGFPLVGIGASAGGVEALQAFFRAMPAPAAAIAFVAVTHLGAGHESALPEILQKCTAMPVLPLCHREALHGPCLCGAASCRHHARRGAARRRRSLGMVLH